MHENIKISDIEPLITEIDTDRVVLQSLALPAAGSRNIRIDVLRLDLLHPVISGNKWFKLKYHLQKAKQLQKKGILSFGGAWSNHLVATAASAQLAGLSAIGIVRGEAPPQLSPTLLDAQHYGMHLQFIPRTQYADERTIVNGMTEKYPEYLVVPAGGQSDLGVRGAAEILSLVSKNDYTHIAAAAGTGTMLAGLLHTSQPDQVVLGFSSLKISDPDNNTLISFVRQYSDHAGLQMIYQYHFGGYARMNDTLLNFMNDLYEQYQLPTDLVYTGKLFYGISDLVANNFFPMNSRLLVVHSGGLQGNRSVKPGILRF